MENSIKKLIGYGFFGKSLNSIDQNELKETLNFDEIEIISKSEANDSSNSLNISPAKINFKNEINSIEKENFIIRITPSIFKEIVLKNKLIKSKNQILIVDYFIKNKNANLKEIKKIKKLDNKSINQCLKILLNNDIILKIEKESYKINEDRIDQNIKNFLNNNKKSSGVKKLKKTEKKEINLEISDLINNSKELVKEHPNGIPLKSLKTILRINDRVLSKIIDFFQNDQKYEITKKNEKPTKIKYKIENDDEIIKGLIELGKRNRVFVLSEKKNEIKNLINKDFNEEKILEIFEKKEFKVIELRSKYIQTEFIVFLKEINTYNEILVDTITKTKNKIFKEFKEKIRKNFLENYHLSSIDNGLSLNTKLKVEYFYNFLTRQMKKNNMKLYLKNKMLKELTYKELVSCIPINKQFIALEIVSSLNENKFFDEKLNINFTKKDLQINQKDKYIEFNEYCKYVLNDISINDILKNLDKNDDTKKYLERKINISKFNKIISLLVKYNIFESYNDGVYVYFEIIDGIDDYIVKIFENIKENVLNDESFCVYEKRLEFFNSVIEFSQDEFYEKTKIFIESNFSDLKKKQFFTKILETFK